RIADRPHQARRADRQPGRAVAVAGDAERSVRGAGARLGVPAPARGGGPGRRRDPRARRPRLRRRERDRAVQGRGGAPRRRRPRLRQRARRPGRARRRPLDGRGSCKGSDPRTPRDPRERRRGGSICSGFACRARLLAPRGLAPGRGRRGRDRQRHLRTRRDPRRLDPGTDPDRPAVPRDGDGQGGARGRRDGRHRPGSARRPGRRVLRALDGRAGSCRGDARRRRLDRMTLELVTAGESHGPALVAIVSGLPAGLVLDKAAIDADLRRRQQGYGRSPRQQIETDEAEVLAGLRHGRTLGSPLALVVRNRDHKNWTWGMSPWPPEGEPEGKGKEPVTLPRPGHADLAGALKYGLADVRDALERASARHTAVLVAAGSVAKALLLEIGIEVAGTTLGDDLEQRVDQARKARDTVGGRVEVRAGGVPPGLGSYASRETRLDARLAAAVM